MPLNFKTAHHRRVDELLYGEELQQEFLFTFVNTNQFIKLGPLTKFIFKINIRYKLKIGIVIRLTSCTLVL